jgi:putative inorganic carbon (HCO3(-)) transporter
VGFFVLLLYLVLTLIRPWELMPWLAEYRLAFWVGNIGLLVSVISFLFRGRFTLFRTPELYTLLTFVCVLVLSPALAQGWIGGVIEAFNIFMTPFLGCMLIFLNVDSLRKLKITAGVITVCAIVLVIQGVISYHFGWKPELFIMAQTIEQFDDAGERLWFGRMRALGFLNDPNDLAQALLTIMPWMWPLWNPERKARNLILIILPTALLLYGVLLTRSRGGVVTVLVIITLRMRERLKSFRNLIPVTAAICLGALMVAAGATGGRDISADDDSAEGRIDAWRAGLEMLQSHPITGVGFNAYTDYHERVAHNSFVHCFAELGLMGYFCWLALLLMIHSRLSALSRVNTDTPDGDTVSRWATSCRFSFYGFLTSAFFLSRTYAPMLYMLIGVSMALDVAARQIGYDERTTPAQQVYGRAAALAVTSVLLIYAIVKVS